MPSTQPKQLGKSRLVKKSSDILEKVSSDGNGMCCSYNMSHTALHLSSIIKPKVLCIILNENSSPQNAISVDQYLKLMKNCQLKT
jgi:hypothetical protein